MTINYLDSKRLQGLSTERTYLTETVYNQGNASWQGALTLYGAGNTRIGIRVESGSSSIGKTISKIRGELSATNAGGGVTGTFRWTIRNNTDTLIAYTPDVNASTLPEATTEANIEYTFNVARSLLEGDRIQLEYSGGDATHTVNLSYNNTGVAMPTGFKQCKYNGSYTDISNFPVYFITDSSPALVNNLPNIQTNSIFEQTDTNTRHWYNGTNWITQPTFEDNFTTNKMTYVDSGFSFGTNVQDFTVPNTLGSPQSYIDVMGATISDTNWILRCKLIISSYSVNTTNTIKRNFIGFFSSTSDMTTAQDGIFFNYGSEGSASDLRIGNTDGVAPNANTGDNFTTATSATTYYLEIIRVSSISTTINIYSNSEFSTLVESQTKAVASTVIGLRYLQHSNRSGNTNGTIIGTIDDIKFYNGVTSV